MAADGTASPRSPPPPPGVEKQLGGHGDGREGMRKKQQLVVVDHMGRLPEEIVMVIVNKLFDLKTLLRLSLVAKRYSSLVSLTHSLLVELPSVTGSSREAEAAAAAARFSLGQSQIFYALTDHRFQQIKHLHLHLRAIKPQALGSGNGSDLFPTTVAVFGSHLEQFQLLSAASVNPIPIPATFPAPAFNASAFNVALVAGLNNAPALEEAGLDDEAASEGTLKKFKELLICASKQHAIVRRHASQCKMIETAVCSDSLGRATLVMGKQQTAKLKASASEDNHPPPPQLRVLQYHLPSLDLPKTGYALKDVTFTAVMMSGVHQDAKQHVQAMMGGCEAEEMENGGYLDDFDFQKLNVFTEAAPLIFNPNVTKVTLHDFVCPYEQLLPKKD